MIRSTVVVVVNSEVRGYLSNLLQFSWPDSRLRQTAVVVVVRGQQTTHTGREISAAGVLVVLARYWSIIVVINNTF